MKIVDGFQVTYIDNKKEFIIADGFSHDLDGWINFYVKKSNRRKEIWFSISAYNVKSVKKVSKQQIP